jgi:tRNA 5-methylaminomethyl-2-thiouridine biosynthesis bifunctional protein
VVWAGLLGEALADQITGQPVALELELMQAIAPERFARSNSGGSKRSAFLGSD